MERGVALNPELIDKVMHPNKIATRKKALPRGQGARVAGIVVIAFGVGYAIFASFIAVIAPSARLPMLGVSPACSVASESVFSLSLRSYGANPLLRTRENESEIFGRHPGIGCGSVGRSAGLCRRPTGV
jgi:hypothetical protein